MQKQDIRCNVTHCRFNDHESHCNKGSVTIGCTTPKAQSKCDTECSSFEECCK